MVNPEYDNYKLLPTITFKKTHPNATIPTKHPEDLGYDIYTIETHLLQPGEIHPFKTGLTSQIPLEYGILLRERGSTGIIGLTLKAGVIDSGYRGEWLILLQNTNPNKIPILITQPQHIPTTPNKEIITYTKAIAQAIITHNIQANIQETTQELTPTQRNTGKLGSTGK